MSEPIGVIGSPSSTQTVTVDILEKAAELALHGQLVYLIQRLDTDNLFGIGTITEIRTLNRWHEDTNMRGVIKQHGPLPHLSAKGDVRTAEIRVQAVYSSQSPDPRSGDPATESGASLAMSPSTGTKIHQVTSGFLNALLRGRTDDIVYLGNIYRSDVRLPLTLRHFGTRDSSGAGEAYHTGIFGMTGSGKTSLAAYLVLAYLRHREMGVLIIDPQGQFTAGEGLPFSLHHAAKELDRAVFKYSISDGLKLPKDAPLLCELLGLTRFFDRGLSIKAKDNSEIAAAEFRRIIVSKQVNRPKQGWEKQTAPVVLRAVLERLLNDGRAMERIYSGSARRALLATTIGDILEKQEEFDRVLDYFGPIHSLFTDGTPGENRRTSLEDVVKNFLEADREQRPLVMLDFSSTRSHHGSGSAHRLLDSTAVKARILRKVCSLLARVAEGRYKDGSSLNTLVVFDEAHRFAAESADDEQSELLAGRLTDYVRTTRKYGLGWMFITQEISSLRQRIYNQLRVRVFGYGLTSGRELRRLEDAIGDSSSLDLYRSFVDPAAVGHSAYPFMITGPVSPLSFTGAPVFLSVFTDHDEFRLENGYRKEDQAF